MSGSARTGCGRTQEVTPVSPAPNALRDRSPEPPANSDAAELEYGCVDWFLYGPMPAVPTQQSRTPR